MAVLVCSISPVAGQDSGATAQGVEIPICLVGHWDEYDGLFSDVWAEGDYAYLGNWGNDGNEARVHIVDISDPSNPTLASTFFVPFPNQFASPQDVKVHNGLLFIALEADPGDSVAIVDVRDPTSPSLLATILVAGFERLHNLFYDQGYLYLAASSSGSPDVAIMDLTLFDPDNPPPSPITSPKWTLTNIGGQFVHDITVKSGRLYVAAWDSMHIYDVTNVATTIPTWLGSVAGSAKHSMWPTDDGQYVVTGEERSNGGGIHVYRMTDNGGSISLTQTDSLVLTGASSVHNQMFVGNRLYNSWYGRGLQIHDVDPISGLLQPVGEFDTSTSGTGNWGVYPLLGSDRILLSDTNEGLFIVTETCVCEPSAAPLAETIRGTVNTKNRFLSFTGSEPGRLQAARVTFVDLPAPYDLWNGESLWVGAPKIASQSGSSAVPVPSFPNFLASQLTCEGPSFQDWAALGSVSVFHEGIVPGGTYVIQLIDSSCPDLFNEGSFSPALELPTTKWGDTVTDLSLIPPAPAEGALNISDALAILGRFSGVSTSIVKARADLEPRCADFVINIADVLSSLRGFQGLGYPFAPSAADACSSNCTSPLP